jgi:hypothetical protein
MDSTVQHPLAVVFCGWQNLPEATERRLKDGEGICYGWAKTHSAAERLAAEATEEGCLNISIVATTIRELP